MLYKKVVTKIFTKIIGKQLRLGAFFNKTTRPQSCNFPEKTALSQVFVNIGNKFKTAVLQNKYERLILETRRCKHTNLMVNMENWFYLQQSLDACKYSCLENLTEIYQKYIFKISQNSQENTCARIYFLIKLRAYGLQLY